MAKAKKPRKFDYNLVVIGAGSAGLVSAYVATTLNAKVALIEANKMGGECLNTGCVPSKALIRSARILHYVKRAQEFGFNSAEVSWDFKDVMARVHNIIAKIAPHDSLERYTQLGVECIIGKAKVVDRYTIKVDDRTLTTKNIIIAAGAAPFVPDLPGINQVDYLHSDNIWQLQELPKRLAVVGSGPIGCELAQCFRRFGCEVTLIGRRPTLLPREDHEVGEYICKHFSSEGINILRGYQADNIVVEDKQPFLVCNKGDRQIKIAFDRVLLALGRKPNITGYGLEELGVKLRHNGTIAADPFMRTNYSNIYVCGDITGPYQFTHVAAHQAWYAVLNSLFSPFSRFKVNYNVIPWCTFTDPEIAHVGLNETTAQAQKIPCEITRYELNDLDRAICDSEDKGFVKVLTKPGKDTILGATIVGHNASNYINEFVLAMQHGLGLNKILSTIHIYPTLSEANKYLAGNWRKNHKPEGLLKLLRWFHAWRRS